MKTKISNEHLLNSAVLVLNANYSPMTVCTAKRAITLYFLNKIDVLSNYNAKVHSPSISLDIPSVIKIKTYIKNNSMAVEISRKNILVRDNYTCQYCGIKPDNKTLTLDHIIPRSKGGASVWENVVTCCKPCNQIKCDKEIPIKHNSFMPSYWDIVKLLKKRPISIHHHWLPYIDWPDDLITVTKRAA